MAQRKNKPQVTTELRQKWLERSERGESPPMIARSDIYDPRTIRKYIEIGKQERESKDARGSVLRGALERHYADLCYFVEGLGGQPSGGHADDSAANISARYGEQLRSALREHLPMSPIWGYLSKTAKLNACKAEIIRQIGGTIEANITADKEIKRWLADDETEVVTGIIEALQHQVEKWAEGLPGLNVTNNLQPGRVEGGLVGIRYGPFNMGWVREGHIDLLGKSITDWTVRIKDWESLRDAERTFRDLERVEEKLRGEIAVIVLRRVLPGRCRYCPL